MKQNRTAPFAGQKFFFPRAPLSDGGRIQFKLVVGILLGSMPFVVFGQQPVVLDFDDQAAPCDLGSAQPLDGQFVDPGVLMVSTGEKTAVLHECSGLGVPGYSTPNFLFVDSEDLEVARLGFHLHFYFGSWPRLIRLNVGGTPGTTGSLVCYTCERYICREVQEFVMNSSMQTIEVSGGPFVFGCGLYMTETDGLLIVDDIEIRFTAEEPRVPSVSK